MRVGVNALVARSALIWTAAAVLSTVVVPVARADVTEGAGSAAEEDRWVASLAVTSGVWFQNQHGSIDSCLFANGADTTDACPAPGATPLRPSESKDDLAIAAFVGPIFEVMSPALPIPTRPRVFVSGEILPTFAADRDVAGEGDPSCIQGPRPSDVGKCLVDQTGPRDNEVSQDDLIGDGSVVSTTYDTLAFGAAVGLAFPAKLAERRLWIRPSFGWVSYKAEMDGNLVDGKCQVVSVSPFFTRCTPVQIGGTILPGSLRQINLMGHDSQRFHAIGPGLDIEMDTGRFGPIGTSLFLGGRAYRTFGDTTLEASTSMVYPNDGLPLANQGVSAHWEIELDRWIYRTGVGLHIRWLGWEK